MTTYNTAIIETDIELSRQQERWLNRAVGVAYQRVEDEENHLYRSNYFLGAVIVKSGRLLALGTNRVRNDPNNPLMDSSAYGVHAEMRALQNLRGSDNSYSAAKGATIYVARVTKGNNHVVMARPCDDCYAELRRVGVSTIIYTTSEGTAQAS